MALILRKPKTLPIQKTDAVILRRIKYSETSLIVTAYSRDFGKISLMAKGARNPKSKFVGALEPTTISSMVYYHKETRELQMLSEVDLIFANSKIIMDLRKSAVSLAIVGLVNAVITGEEPNESIYQLLEDTLNALNNEEGDVANLWYFELNLLRLLGFGIDLSGQERSGAAGSLNQDALDILELLDRATLPKLGIPGFTRGTFKRINKFFSSYYTYHVEGMGSLKSFEFIESL